MNRNKSVFQIFHSNGNPIRDEVFLTFDLVYPLFKKMVLQQRNKVYVLAIRRGNADTQWHSMMTSKDIS